MGGSIKFMKRYFMLCFVLILSFSGCSFSIELGSSEDITSYTVEQEKEEFIFETTSPVGPSQETVKDTSSNSWDSFMPATITEQILEASLFSGTIQIENEVLTLPISVHKLYSVLSNNQDLNFSISGNSKLNPHSIECATLFIKDFAYSLTIANQTDDSQLLDDCRIIAISTSTDVTSNKKADSLIFPKGFFRGSSYEDICDVYGSPSKEVTAGHLLVCDWAEYPDETKKSLTNRCLTITFDSTTKRAIDYCYSIFQDDYNPDNVISYSIPFSEEHSDELLVCTLPDWIKDEYGLFQTPTKIRYSSHLYGEIDYFICASYSLIPNKANEQEDFLVSDAHIYNELHDDPILKNYNHSISTIIQRDSTMLRYGRICCSEYEGIVSVFFRPKQCSQAIRIDYLIQPVYDKAGSINESIVSDLKSVYETLLAKSELISQ